MKALPLFPITTVGSWPRSIELLRAQKLRRQGTLSEEEFERVADKAVLNVLRLQEEAGVDLVTDGEQRRDNFYSFVAAKLEGVRLMTLAEMLNLVEDTVSFERILRTLDVPSYSISNATCMGKVRRARPLAVEELRFVQKHTDKPVKVTLPGPYLLTRSMYLSSVSSKFYPTKEDLAEDVIQVLSDETRELIEQGAAFVQFDEPVLTELVFTQGQTRTFMCAALAARKDPAEELEFAVSLINRVVDAFRDSRVGIHICRGNWSKNEATLLRGSYHPLVNYLNKLDVRQLVLEYATERAGDILYFEDKELGLGVVNPRIERVESVEEIKCSIERALQLYPPEKLWLNPDCGFSSFSNRPVNSSDIALRKLRNLVVAAQSLRP
ncbi:MAG: cobalamin-independent methionine synthase II family protein [Chloroflexi bacterium]|nr:cobalamin-independent methionine synthase II family protein [Chloroflexota bacterium]